MYSDHDIIIQFSIFDFNQNFIQTDLINKYKFISFDHSGDSKQNLTKIFKFDIILKAKYNHFVATGCFICTYDTYKLLYHDNDVIYGNEDIIIGNILKDNNITSYIHKLKVHHPLLISDKYNDYKHTQIKNIIKNYE